MGHRALPLLSQTLCLISPSLKSNQNSLCRPVFQRFIRAHWEINCERACSLELLEKQNRTQILDLKPVLQLESDCLSRVGQCWPGFWCSGSIKVAASCSELRQVAASCTQTDHCQCITSTWRTLATVHSSLGGKRLVHGESESFVRRLSIGLC